MSNAIDWRDKLSEASNTRRTPGTTGMVRLHRRQYRILQHISKSMNYTQTGLINALVEDAYDGLLAEQAIPALSPEEMGD
jgi:hypothetical protein|tara:strand:- start:244 stop:483 length:240 start_codon:yes stop_codon:yes gene_type:complete